MVSIKKIKEYLIFYAAHIFVGVLALFPIRIGCPNCDRVHFLLNTEFWLRTNPKSQRGLYFFVSKKKPYNLQLLKMIKRHVPVLENDFITKLFSAFERRTPKSKLWLPLQNSGYLFLNQWNAAEPQILMIEEERRRGRELLKDIGVPEGEPFICFHARDDRYLNEAVGRLGWEYHSYRNTEIENYLPAMEGLVKQGYWALRMGALVEKPIKISHPKLIDYATTCRTDFMDIFLLDTCEFFVGDTAGITMIPTTFNKPCVMVNATPLQSVARNKNSLFIFKKYRDRKTGRMLTIKEIFGRQIETWYSTQQYEEAGIDVIENSSEEITDVVMEMHLRLKGKWISTAEDDRLQKHFHMLVPQGHAIKGFISRVGSAFLRNNQYLFE